MAKELKAARRSGQTLYAVIHSPAGQWWNTATSAFENYNAANWANYKVALTEDGASGFYTGNFPTAIVTAGLYDVGLRIQAGGAAAVSDTADGAVQIDWDGAAEILPASRSEYTAARAAKLDNLDATITSRPTAAQIDTQLSGTHGSGLWQQATTLDPTLCRIYGYEYSGQGKPVSGRTVAAEIASPPQTTSSVILESERFSTVSGSDGYWYLDVVRGKVYRFILAEAGIDQTLTAPNAASVDLRTLLT